MNPYRIEPTARFDIRFVYIRSRKTAASGPTTSILPSVDASRAPAAFRTARHSRSTAASRSSPSSGKYRGRSHCPTFSKTAPLSTWAPWIGVVRFGSSSAGPRSIPASTENGTGTYGGRAAGPSAGAAPLGGARPARRGRGGRRGSGHRGPARRGGAPRGTRRRAAHRGGRSGRRVRRQIGLHGAPLAFGSHEVHRLDV